jgi:hypothetical protein
MMPTREPSRRRDSRTSATPWTVVSSSVPKPSSMKKLSRSTLVDSRS